MQKLIIQLSRLLSFCIGSLNAASNLGITCSIKTNILGQSLFKKTASLPKNYIIRLAPYIRLKKTGTSKLN